MRAQATDSCNVTDPGMFAWDVKLVHLMCMLVITFQRTNTGQRAKILTLMSNSNITTTTTTTRTTLIYTHLCRRWKYPSRFQHTSNEGTISTRHSGASSRLDLYPKLARRNVNMGTSGTHVILSKWNGLSLRLWKFTKCMYTPFRPQETVSASYNVKWCKS